jgi:hypothetical protein
VKSRSALRLGSSGLTITSLFACTSTPPSPDPCEIDVLRCRAATGFELDQACTTGGELAVELGEGATDFVELTGESQPEIHEGSQGGRHLFLALRLPNPDPAHGLFQAFIRLEELVGDAGTEDLAERDLVFRLEDAKGNSGEAVELTSIVLVLPDDVRRGMARLVLDIRDSCDRRGQTSHAFRWL